MKGQTSKNWRAMLVSVLWDQTDAGKLAREVDLPGARDNDLVPNQKEHNDDALAF
jgi:hypothetical protein